MTLKSVKRSVVAHGEGEGGTNRWGTEDCEGSEVTPYDTVMVDARHICLKPWNIQHLRVDLNIDHRL